MVLVVQTMVATTNLLLYSKDVVVMVVDGDGNS